MLIYLSHMSNPSPKKILSYFRSNLFESFSAYNTWKMLEFSPSPKVVSVEMAERYAEIQRYHPEFFVLTKRALLVDFVLMSLHAFDSRTNDSYSLYQIDQKHTENFIKENKKTIEALRFLRNKVFAHRDLYAEPSKHKLPPVTELDNFFQNLIKFYNRLTKEHEDSTTIFDNAEKLQENTEWLLVNLYRGEAVRRREIDIECWWKMNNKKASDVLGSEKQSQ